MENISQDLAKSIFQNFNHVLLMTGLTGPDAYSLPPHCSIVKITSSYTHWASILYEVENVKSPLLLRVQLF